ncbi:MAG TPA: hydrogenase formation protein HypD [Rectinemataceae bacterium]|nr:hydrogenase formation protein HypD [Rectinemataceae bacterium]
MATSRIERPFRDRERAAALAREIGRVAGGIGREVRIMEVCGSHTVALRQHGIRSLLPANIRFVSGPGCPVCVTPSGYVANALRLIEEKGATVATFGDMVKVPDPSGRSLSAHQGSGRLRIVYSPRELPDLARSIEGPLVFLGIGFETTAPAIASAFLRARDEGVGNLFLYAAFKTVPTALRALVSDPECSIDAFLLPGHVSVVIGLEPYRFLAEEFGIPGVVGGFEPIDMLMAILRIVILVAEGRAGIENAYGRAVRDAGNEAARLTMDRLLEPAPALWRGLGLLEGSGLGLKVEARSMDAEAIFGLDALVDLDPPGCRCAQVIQGKAEPDGCPLFGRSCTPDRPVGPCMVSSEGSCAAHFRYGGAEI